MSRQSFFNTALQCMALMVLVGCSKPLVFTLHLSQQTLQTQLEKRFPITLEEPARAELTHPVVILNGDDDRLGLRVAISVEPPAGPPIPAPRLPDKPLQGVVEVSGVLRYDSDQGALHMDAPKIEKFAVAGLPDPLTEAIKRSTEKVLAVYLSEHPVHTLSDDERLQAAGKKLLQEVRVQDGNLRITLGL